VQQGERTDISPHAAGTHITKVWQQSDSGSAFAKGLEASGWILARGNKRDFVVIDPKGGAHSLARRIDGAKAKEVRARLADLAMSRLPSVAEAKAMQSAPSVGQGEIKTRTPKKAKKGAAIKDASDLERLDRKQGSARRVKFLERDGSDERTRGE
jgi:hypothetical protein